MQSKEIIKEKILTKMVHQFEVRYGNKPVQIVVEPQALIVLAWRRSVSTLWNGIPVRCAELNPCSINQFPNALGITITEGHLRSFGMFVVNAALDADTNFIKNSSTFMIDGYIAVDLDGTLAVDKWPEIGEPVPEMADRVRRWHRNGFQVKIFTARASDPKQIQAIKIWLLKHRLPDLEVTNIKDKNMIEYWDDRAVEVIKNNGRAVNLVKRMTALTGY